jgi:NAD(P)H-hydrate epimerase
MRPKLITRLPDPPRRPAESHKGTFGTVMVIGGCTIMPGAPALTARAALRSGAGLVKIATDAATLPHTLHHLASATGVRLADDATQARDAIKRADPKQRAVLAVGPGWAGNPAVAVGARPDLLAELWDGPRDLILDADGLNVLAELLRDEALPKRNAAETRTCRILTPHPGEFARLADAAKHRGAVALAGSDRASRQTAAVALARACRAIVVLKGRQTVVADADGRRIYLNRTGNPALATAGTGDVLTGLIAGLRAQGLDGFDAACLGVHVHGIAADRWATRHGSAGLLAEELADELPAVLR